MGSNPTGRKYFFSTRDILSRFYHPGQKPPALLSRRPNPGSKTGTNGHMEPGQKAVFVVVFPFTGNTDIYYGYVGVVRDSTFNFLRSKESTLLLHGCMCGFQMILPNLVLRISTFTFSIKLLISPLNFFFPFIYLIVRLAFGLLEVLGPTVKQSHLSSVSI